MQHLGEKVLRRLNYYPFFGSVVLFGTYVFLAIQQDSTTVEGYDFLGINPLTTLAALTCVIYNLGFLRLVRRYNVWVAYVISTLIFVIATNAAAETSIDTPGAYVFIAANFLIICSSVAFGPIAAFSGLIVSALVFGITLAGNAPPSPLGLTGDAISLGLRVIIVSVILFLVKDKYFTDSKTTSYISQYFVSNEVVKLLTDSITDGVIIIDSQGVVKSINPGAALILGQPQKDILDLNYKSILKLKSLQNIEVSPEQDPVQQALSGKQSVNQEFNIQVATGPDKIIDVNVSPIANPTTGILYGAAIIIRDISKKKREEAARSEFISTASHEMRTPVAAIEGYLALALNPQVSNVDEKARGFLQKAHQSTEHLGRLFQDLLVSAKAEDGRLISHPSVIELSGFLTQLTDDLRMITVKRGLELEYVTGTGKNVENGREKVVQPLYYVYADPDRLREIITNLFDNAVKYTEKGKITIGLTGNKEVVQFFIRDTGVGIPAEDIPHLFQKFYRVDTRATRTTGGTGLGLFISRKILELYKGKIWVDSQAGKGSTFYVNLPRLSSSQAIAKQTPAPQPATQPAITPTQTTTTK